MNRTQDAIDYIIICCSTIGSTTPYQLPTNKKSVEEFVKEVATDIENSSPTTMFPDRYKEHVAYALNMVAKGGLLPNSPAAVASVYLVTRLEFWFRLLSEVLETNGKWINEQAQQKAQKAISDDRLKFKRINNVALAYELFREFCSKDIVKIFKQLDNRLYSDGNKHIGYRINHLRIRSAHGEWGDISSEAYFYSLLVAIIFYNQN